MGGKNLTTNLKVNEKMTSSKSGNSNDMTLNKLVEKMRRRGQLPPEQGGNPQGSYGTQPNAQPGTPGYSSNTAGSQPGKEPFPGTPAHRALHPELYPKLPGGQGYGSQTGSVDDAAGGRQHESPQGTGNSPDLVDRLLTSGESAGQYENDIYHVIVDAVNKGKPLTFAKAYLLYSDINRMGGNSLFIAVALIPAFSGDETAIARVMDYAKFGEQMRQVRNVMRSNGKSVMAGFAVMDKIHKAVSAGAKDAFDALYAKEPAAGQIAKLMTMRYQLEGNSDYFQRLNAWALDRKVEDIRSGRFFGR